MSKSIRLKNNIYLDYSSIKKYASHVSDNDDLNTYLQSGTYRASNVKGLINSPLTDIDGMLFVEDTKNANMIYQVLFNRLTAQIWFRIYWYSAFWTEWKEL